MFYNVLFSIRHILLCRLDRIASARKYNAEYAERRLSAQRKTGQGFTKKPEIQEEINRRWRRKDADKEKKQFITLFELSDFPIS
jgi:hypothetical protein